MLPDQVGNVSLAGSPPAKEIIPGRSITLRIARIGEGLSESIRSENNAAPRYVKDVDVSLAIAAELVKVIDPDRESSLRQAIEDLYFGYRAFTALPDQILAARGLGRTHHRILYFVCRTPEISIGELLSVLRITKQAAHRPVKDLESQGLLAIATDVQDRRVRRLSPTREGAELEAQLSQAQMQLLDAAFRDSGEVAELHWRQVMTRLRRETTD
jgi:DNA-binding MarR family transcriptional regulator